MSEYTYIIERKPIKKTVTEIGLHMFIFDADFTRIRYKDKDKKCHICKAEFKDKERISLAFIRNEKNHLLCESCASFLTTQGVPYKDFKRGNP